MTTLTITRPVTRKIVEDATFRKDVEMRETRKGGVELIVNGEKVLALTSTGYLRRFPVSAEVGMRRNKAGKVAFKVTKADETSSNEDIQF